MNEIEKNKIAYDIANKELDKASKMFEERQIETINNSVKFSEKLSLSSVGIISLSMTFVGYLINENKQIFSLSFICCDYHFPIYVFMYFGWVCLMIVSILGLFIRHFSNNYLYFNSLRYYLESGKKATEKKIPYLETYSNIYDLDGNDREEMINNEKEVLKNREKLLSLPKMKKEDFFLKLQNSSIKIIIISFVIGIISILSFIILSINSLIKFE